MIDSSDFDYKVGVIGLGYVGLPLAIAAAKVFSVIGFDLSEKRVDELRNNIDTTNEVESEKLASTRCTFSSNPEVLVNCNFYVVCVPTPVDNAMQPDLGPITKATELISRYISDGDFVVLESTVYPGATEEICVPILEASSELKLNEGFFLGYSPERINPGDKKNTIEKIIKVTSGSNEFASNVVNYFYSKFVSAGTFKAATIRTAEAAKVIENTQRDVNIALINELALIFEKLGIDTLDVLEAASTKWNFLKFTPGLVGGHCISVDPYYLTHCARKVNYNPEMILAGRRINDSMPENIVNRLISEMVKKRIDFSAARILVLGITFKEDCPDIRNTKVGDVIKRLENLDIHVDLYDPIADPNELWDKFRRKSVKPSGTYDVIIGAVKHAVFHDTVQDLNDFLCSDGIVFDLKGFLPRNISTLRL